MGFSRISVLMMMMVVVLGISMMEKTRAQGDCTSGLIPCATFLNSTKPPESCCKPLRETIEKQLPCLCKLYNDPSLLPSLGINVTQALELPKHCGVSVGSNLCKQASVSAKAPSPSATLTPPGVPGVPGAPGSDKGSSSKMAWTGLSSILLFWGFMIAY